jgi:hypothetical protein
VAVFGSSGSDEAEVGIVDNQLPLNTWSHLVASYNGRSNHAETAIWLNCRSKFAGD